MPIEVKSIFSDLQRTRHTENFLELFQSASTKIERTVSRSYSSPADFWYDPPEDEWVMVLCGHATLEFEGGEYVELKAGDYLTILRHVRHRVARTSEETIWLAVHTK